MATHTCIPYEKPLREKDIRQVIEEALPRRIAHMVLLRKGLMRPECRVTSPEEIATRLGLNGFEVWNEITKGLAIVEPIIRARF